MQKRDGVSFHVRSPVESRAMPAPDEVIAFAFPDDGERVGRWFEEEVLAEGWGGGYEGAPGAAYGLCTR